MSAESPGDRGGCPAGPPLSEAGGLRRSLAASRPRPLIRSGACLEGPTLVGEPRFPVFPSCTAGGEQAEQSPQGLALGAPLWLSERVTRQLPAGPERAPTW